ncbi:hypothetical protein CEDDRAFT_03516 [Frankia sp. CeD]|nr:hypothetical protein BMG523Draft_02774 [Frankia sp. BMG5.23]KEZ35105.1 hypothetical protein CEDDRAFT_03516 [Frankia sp. CeD]
MRMDTMGLEPPPELWVARTALVMSSEINRAVVSRRSVSLQSSSSSAAACRAKAGAVVVAANLVDARAQVSGWLGCSAGRKVHVDLGEGTAGVTVSTRAPNTSISTSMACRTAGKGER